MTAPRAPVPSKLKWTPCARLQDELDSLGGSRERGDMHEASRRLLSVLLRYVMGLRGRGCAICCSLYALVDV
eukprot:1160222-Pelagomonas_calceolata.AAC.4